MEWIGNGTGTLPARFTKRLYAMAANTFMRSTNRNICVKKHQKYRVNQILFVRSYQRIKLRGRIDKISWIRGNPFFLLFKNNKLQTLLLSIWKFNISENLIHLRINEASLEPNLSP